MEEKQKTPHHLYLALIGALIVVVGAAAVAGFAQLSKIGNNVTSLTANLSSTAAKLDVTVATTNDTLKMVNGALKGSHKNGDDGYLVLGQRTLQNVNSATNAAKQTLQSVNTITKAQETRATELSKASVDLVKSGNDSLQSLNKVIVGVNGVVDDLHKTTLPKLNEGVDVLNGLAADLRPLVGESTNVVKSLNITAQSANAIVSDPEIKSIVHNLNLTSDNVNKTTAGFVVLTADVHNILSPKKTTFVEALAETMARSVLGAIAGPLIAHFWPVQVSVTNAVPVQK